MTDVTGVIAEMNAAFDAAAREYWVVRIVDEEKARLIFQAGYVAAMEHQLNKEQEPADAE